MKISSINNNQYKSNIYHVTLPDKTRSKAFLTNKNAQDAFAFTGKFVDYNKLRTMNIQNLRRIDSNIIAGGTLENKALSEFQKIKESGIECIIDFRAEGSGELEKKCKKIGLEYFKFPLNSAHNTDNPIIFSKEGDNIIVNQDFVNKLKKFIELKDNKNVYIGCQHGIDRTNIGSMLTYYFGKEKNPPILLNWPGEKLKYVINSDVKLLRKIEKYLSPEQKTDLNLNSDSHSAFYDKSKKLVKKNMTFLNSNF